MPYYALVGAFATTVHYLALVTLVEWVGLHAGLATALGAVCGALAAYAGNHRLTFAARTPHARALPRFLAVAALGVVINAALVAAGTEWLGLPYLLPQVAATAIVLLTGFTLNRRWSFA